MFSIGLLGVCRPLIRAVELFYEPFGQQSLKVSHKDDVVLAMEVNPAVVASPRIVLLSLACHCPVEDIIKRLLVNVAQKDIKVLAKRHLAIAVNDEVAHNTMATQPQMPVSPLVI